MIHTMYPENVSLVGCSGCMLGLSFMGIYDYSISKSTLFYSVFSKYERINKNVQIINEADFK